LADEGLGNTATLFTYIRSKKRQIKTASLKEPKPAREISLIFPKGIKIQIIDARSTIAGVVKVQLYFRMFK
jgi:LysR family hydrogen peroxide-inducible transcriptional activator